MENTKRFSIHPIPFEDGYSFGFFVDGQLVQRGSRPEDLLPYVHGYVFRPDRVTAYAE